MTSPEQLARERLAAASHAKDRARRAAWITLAVALVTIVLLAVAVADYWVVLPMGVRLAGLAVVALLVGVGTARTVRLLLEHTPIKEAALDAEQVDPRLGCMVSTAAEYLSGERRPTLEYEPELVAALEQEAARAMYRVKVPYWKALRLPLAMLACAMLILLGFLAFSTGAGTALKRVASPWQPITYTTVEVTPGDVELPVGRDLNIESVFRGRQPKDPRFHWLGQGEAKWHKTDLPTNETGTYVYSVKSVQTPFSYRVTGGDAASAEFRVSPYIPPAVKELNLKVELPPYTGRAPLQQTSPDVTVLRGSTVAFQVQPNVDLKQARLVFDRLPPVDLAKGPDGLWLGNLQITTNAEYWIELTDWKNHIGTNTEPHHLKALPDEPPKVEITEPGQDIRAQANDTVPLIISVTDDYGVGEIRIVYNKLGGPEQSLVVTSRSVKKDEVLATAELPLAGLNLRDYEVVAYHAEALDNNTYDGPGIGRSPLYFIEITGDGSGSGKPSKSQGQSPKVNLLVIQKQIIADTKALASNSSPEKFKELAEREKTAREFAEMYQQAMDQMGAPEEARQEMNQTLAEMTKATEALEKPDRNAALPAEENALAHMYQLLKQMPQLQNLPTQPQQQQQQNPMLNVVMEAIKKKQAQPPDNQELADLTEQIEQLAQSQAAVNQALQQMVENRNQDTGEARPNGEQSPGQQTGQPQENGQPSQSGQPAQANQPGQQNQAAQAGQTGQPSQSGQQQPAQPPGAASQKSNTQKSGKNGQQGEQGQAGQEPQSGKGKGGEQAQGQKSGKGEANGKGEKGGQGQQSKKGDKGQKGQGKGQGEQAGGQGKGGEPQPNGEKQPGTGANGEPQQPGTPGQQGQQNVPSLEELAKQEEQLSQEGAELAQKLDKLAGKDKRLGHNVSKVMSKAVGQMSASAKSLKGGLPGKGFSQAQEGGYGLNTVTAMLQKLLELEQQLTDTSAEDFPKEYEAAIQEYLKRLSHQE